MKYSLSDLIQMRNYIATNVENIPKQFVNPNHKVLTKIDYIICSIIAGNEFQSQIDEEYQKHISNNN